MSNKIILHAHDLDGYLTKEDSQALSGLDELYKKYLDQCTRFSSGCEESAEQLVLLSKQLSSELERITGQEDQIHVYSFETPREKEA